MLWHDDKPWLRKGVGEAVTVTSVKTFAESRHRKRWPAYATYPSR